MFYTNLSVIRCILNNQSGAEPVHGDGGGRGAMQYVEYSTSKETGTTDKEEQKFCQWKYSRNIKKEVKYATFLMIIKDLFYGTLWTQVM